MNIKKAVIVTAGLSSRLYPLTLDKPKGLLEINNISLLERSINLLKKFGITEIALVVGYKKDLIINQFKESVTYISNPFYKQCNNMGSLWFAKRFINNEPFVYLHGDIIYDEKILEDSLADFLKNSNYAVDLVTDYKHTDHEAMKVRVDKQNYLIESNKEIPLDQANGEWIGLAFIRESKVLFDIIEDTLFNVDLNLYDTFALTNMAKKYLIYCSSTKDKNWVEVDFLADYERAKELFNE